MPSVSETERETLKKGPESERRVGDLHVENVSGVLREGVEVYLGRASVTSALKDNPVCEWNRIENKPRLVLSVCTRLTETSWMS